MSSAKMGNLLEVFGKAGKNCVIFSTKEANCRIDDEMVCGIKLYTSVAQNYFYL